MPTRNIFAEHTLLLQRHGRPLLTADGTVSKGYSPNVGLSPEAIKEVREVNLVRDQADLRPDWVLAGNCRRVVETAMQSAVKDKIVRVMALSHTALCGLDAGPAILELFRQARIEGLVDGTLDQYFQLSRGIELLMSWADLAKRAVDDRLTAQKPKPGSKVLIVGHAVLSQVLALAMVDALDDDSALAIRNVVLRPAEIMVMNNGRYTGLITAAGFDRVAK